MITSLINRAIIFPETLSALKPQLSMEEIFSKSHPIDPKKFENLFKKHFEPELEILSKLGVYPSSGPRLFFDPFCGQTVRDDFSNIGEHCFAVAGCALLLSRFIGEDLELGSSVARDAVGRALLHDAIKPWEIFLAKALRGGKIDKESYYEEQVFNQITAILVGLGIDSRMAEALISDYGSEADVRECFPFFLKVNSLSQIELVKGQTVKKIVHLADNMTCSTTPQGGNLSRHYVLTTWERMIAADADRRYPWALKAGIGLDSAGRITHSSDQDTFRLGGRVLFNIHDALIALSNVIAQEFCPDCPAPDIEIKQSVLKLYSELSA